MNWAHTLADQLEPLTEQERQFAVDSIQFLLTAHGDPTRTPALDLSFWASPRDAILHGILEVSPPLDSHRRIDLERAVNSLVAHLHSS